LRVSRENFVFLVALTNVAQFMWEYKTGSLAPISENSEQNADLDQKQNLLVSELKIFRKL